jgi:hypothetical protein
MKEYKYLKEIPRRLNASNIDSSIRAYLDIINKLPVSIAGDNIIHFLTKVKREETGLEPYPNLTFFEAANRIMTDLTILFGVRRLLEEGIDGVKFDEYNVEFGNENEQAHDIIASNAEYELIGEAFNVAKSYFQGKKTSALKKLRSAKIESKKNIILLIYNSDAVEAEYYSPKRGENEHHWHITLPTSY